ncbi:MAG: OmpA family protein, partial [Methylococcales bacterium]
TTVGIAPIAQADNHQDDRWYVAPFGSYVRPGGDRGAKDGWGGGLGIGKMLNDHFNVELRGFYQGLSTDGPQVGRNQGRWDMTGGTADVQYYINRGKFSPYTVIGLGAMNTSTNGDSGVGFIGEAGAGATYELHDNFLLRGDVRYRYNHNFNAKLQPGTDEFHDMVVNVGFVVPFGAKHAAAEAPVTPAAEPAPVDNCATLDSDGDGVSNCVDKCPSTIAGSKIDSQGCAISLELKGVNFKYDSAVLTTEAMTILDTVAESLVAYPQKSDIEVHGHTSSEGTVSHNLKLSKRRSQSVANYLKQKGVANRLYAKGYGESQPIADNSTEEGKHQNRRVELIWTGN